MAIVVVVFSVSRLTKNVATPANPIVMGAVEVRAIPVVVIVMESVLQVTNVWAAVAQPAK